MTTEPLAYVLVGDGPSDRCLTSVIDWTLRHHRPDIELSTPTFHSRAHQDVEETVQRVQADYAPDLVFVHRDAEKEKREVRRREIPTDVGIVPVIPVRMTEAWLLVDEVALRIAAGNPNGKQKLQMPRLNRIEGLPDPKSVVQGLLASASGLKGRRLRRFNRPSAVRRLAELIGDFSRLLELSAFAAFSHDLQGALDCLEQEG